MQIVEMTVIHDGRLLTYSSLVEGKEEVLKIARAGKDLAGREILSLSVSSGGHTFTFSPSKLVELFDTIPLL